MKLVKSRFRNLYWVEDEREKRVSEKFKVDKIYTYGPLMEISLKDSGVYKIFIAPDRFFRGMNINIRCINNTYYSVDVRGKYMGTYNKGGRNLGEETYVFGYQENVDLYTASYKDKYGFVDKNNNWTIKPKYRSIKTGFVLSKVAIVEVEKDKCVIIDINGTHICKPFDCCEVRRIISNINPEKTAFLIGRDRCIIDGYINAQKWGIIDLNGNVIIPAIYDSVEKVGDFYKLKLNGKYGLANLEGKIILECIYPEIIELEDKFAIHEICVREIPKTVLK